MAEPEQQPAGPLPLRRLGVVVHPSRPLDKVLSSVKGWAEANGVEVGQVIGVLENRRVADPVEAGDCDLLVALGGDGTGLATLRVSAGSGVPVLGVACGSVGALMPVPAPRVAKALDRVAAGRWTPVRVPGIEVSWREGSAVAVNDLAVVRAGSGQVIVGISVDGVRYAGVSGDGVVVATPLGSSAYSLAAGGPLLAPGAEGIVVTPLTSHAAICPPIVVGTGSRVGLIVDGSHGGVRHEIDGQPIEVSGSSLTVAWRSHHATMVGLGDDEPRLTGLRRRGLVGDSPRVLVREGRWEEDELT